MCLLPGYKWTSKTPSSTVSISSSAITGKQPGIIIGKSNKFTMFKPHLLYTPVFCRLGEVLAGGGKLKDLAWSVGGASWLMLLVLFLHSTARRPLQALWQLTPQAAPEWDDGADIRRHRRERGGRRGGSESRRERRPGLEGARERGTGSNKRKGANRNAGVNGRAAGEMVELLHAMQRQEQWHTGAVRHSDPDSNSINQWGAWEKRSNGPLSETAWKYVSEISWKDTVTHDQITPFPLYYYLIISLHIVIWASISHYNRWNAWVPLWQYRSGEEPHTSFFFLLLFLLFHFLLSHHDFTLSRWLDFVMITLAQDNKVLFIAIPTYFIITYFIRDNKGVWL